MAKISKKLRFETFKRDSFTCQYCGRKAPDVVLHLDHITPVSKGGTNDPLNLVTSCQECNSGKSDRHLSDDSVLAAQRQQLAELEERRQQIAMMRQWQDDLQASRDDDLSYLCEQWGRCTHVGLTATGVTKLRGLLKRHGLKNVCDAIEDAAAQTLEFVDGVPTHLSCEATFKAMEKFARVNAAVERNPLLREAFSIRATAAARFDMNYRDKREALDEVLAALEAGVDPERLKGEIRDSHRFDDWMHIVRETRQAAEG